MSKKRKHNHSNHNSSHTSKQNLKKDSKDALFKGFDPPNPIQFPFSTIDADGKETHPEIVQVYIRNPCCCECPLEEGVSCITSLEMIWALCNVITCVTFRLVYTYQDAWKEYGKIHDLTILTLLGCHGTECIACLLLVIGNKNRIRWTCMGWLILLGSATICELALVGWDPFFVTYTAIGIHPVRLYFMYVVFAFWKELKVFPKAAPIPMVRLASSPPGGALHPSTAAPLMIPAIGWGYYPTYYRAVDYGYYPPDHIYYDTHIDLENPRGNLDCWQYHSKRRKDDDNDKK